MVKRAQVSSGIHRRERRAITKIGHSTNYKYALLALAFLFSPAKKFIVLPFSAAKKVFGVISLSIYNFFGIRLGYVDDFIVHKKLRGRGYAQKLFATAQSEAENEKCDYLLLFSKNKRKASHKFYKKVGLTIISCGIGILAYKKINNKK